MDEVLAFMVNKEWEKDEKEENMPYSYRRNYRYGKE